jgi:hypothetical protein
MRTDMRSHPKRLAVLGMCSLVLAACSRDSGMARGDSAAGQLSHAADTASASPMVRGTVASVSESELGVKTDSGTVTVHLTRPVQLYERQPSTLANVKQNSFIGVTTVKQPDGSEQATEIHIFPEALRGVGEGTRMMAQQSAAGGGGSRMTNGSVSGSRMTNGSASPSRMSNGSVASTTGSTTVVQYAGGSTKVVVPPNTPVTEIKPVSRSLAVGDRIIVVATKGADGALVSNRVMLAGK